MCPYYINVKRKINTIIVVGIANDKDKVSNA